MPALLATTVAVALAGCGDSTGYDELNLIDVTGNVTLDDSPLAGARVRFEGADHVGAEAVTDSAGTYRLLYDSERAGCTLGAKTVRITTADANVEGADPDAPASAERLPAAYNRQSTLKADVSESNRTFDFALKSRP